MSQTSLTFLYEANILNNYVAYIYGLCYNVIVKYSLNRQLKVIFKMPKV